VETISTDLFHSPVRFYSPVGFYSPVRFYLSCDFISWLCRGVTVIHFNVVNFVSVTYGRSAVFSCGT
jgi:hypothetical protein